MEPVKPAKNCPEEVRKLMEIIRRADRSFPLPDWRPEIQKEQNGVKPFPSTRQFLDELHRASMVLPYPAQVFIKEVCGFALREAWEERPAGFPQFPSIRNQYILSASEDLVRKNREVSQGNLIDNKFADSKSSWATLAFIDKTVSHTQATELVSMTCSDVRKDPELKRRELLPQWIFKPYSLPDHRDRDHFYCPWYGRPSGPFSVVSHESRLGSLFYEANATLWHHQSSGILAQLKDAQAPMFEINVPRSPNGRWNISDALGRDHLFQRALAGRRATHVFGGGRAISELTCAEHVSHILSMRTVLEATLDVQDSTWLVFMDLSPVQGRPALSYAIRWLPDQVLSPEHPKRREALWFMGGTPVVRVPWRALAVKLNLLEGVAGKERKASEARSTEAQ